MKIVTTIKKRFDFIIKLSDLFDRKEKLQFLGVLIVVIVVALFQVLGIASILPFLSLIMDPEIVYENQLLNQIFNFFGFTSTRSFLVFAGFGVLGIVIFTNLISAFATWLKIRFVWRKNHKISTVLLKKYLSLPYVYFLNQHSADLARNIVSESNQLTRGILLPLIQILTGAVTVLVIIALLLYVNPLVTLAIVMFSAILYLLMYSRLSQRISLGGKKRLAAARARSKVVNETLRGVKDIKFFGREEYFLKRFSKHSKKFSNIQSWNAAVSQISGDITKLIAFGGITGITLALVYFEKSTKQVVPLIGFFAFAGYRLVPVLQKIFASFTSLQFNVASLNKIWKEMNVGGTSTKEISFDRELRQPMTFKKNIKLENMSFSYPGKRGSVLKGINLEIKKATSVAIVGPTGSGKSTLVDIILGLLTPSQGVIKVDGIEVNKKNIRNWQRNLGYVPQQIYIFNDTVARNVALGLPDGKIDISQVKRVAKIANIHDFIEKELPDGYNSIIVEKGGNLSGGQRQRISIARALYNNPEVLVFDEATSSLDTVTEKAVLEEVERLSKLKTLIIISHRFTAVKNCDLIYQLDRGRIVGKGTYDELSSEI